MEQLSEANDEAREVQPQVSEASLTSELELMVGMPRSLGCFGFRTARELKGSDGVCGPGSLVSMLQLLALPMGRGAPGEGSSLCTGLSHPRWGQPPRSMGLELPSAL